MMTATTETELYAKASDLRAAIKAASAKQKTHKVCAHLSDLRVKLRQVESKILSIGFAEMEAETKDRRRRIKLERKSTGLRTFRGFVAQDMNPARTRSIWQVRDDSGLVLSNSCKTLDEVREVIERNM